MVEQAEYEGKEGQTRMEPVHLPEPAGGFASRDVYRVVNVRTHPELKSRMLEGTLHRQQDGRILACSFVYHDPDARLFVLVVPDSTQHHMLAERAALLGRLASDPGHPVPPYVQRADLVVGSLGLEAYLKKGQTQIASALADRERVLASRESRLEAELAATRTQEDSVRLRSERLEALRRELEQREGELDSRFEALREREDALVELVSDETNPGDDELDGVPALDLADSVQLMDDAESLADSVEALVENDLVQDDLVDDVEEDLSADVETLDPGDLLEVSADEVEALEVDETTATELLATELLAEDVLDVIDEDDVEDVGEATVIRKSEPPKAHKSESILPTPATPPESFYSDPQIEMVAQMADVPWLFARMSEGHEDAFRSDEVELLVQYMVIEGYPVILLTLVEWSDPRPYVRRAALDPRRDDDRSLLERLREDFSATVALFGPEGRFERSVEVSALARQYNLELALERAARADGDGDPATALERALAAPPPVKLRGHPFEVADRAADANEAFANVAALSKWSAPAKLDMALLALSIPRSVVDDAFRRILSDATTHGIALPAPLVSRAVSLGVATEPGELMMALIGSFEKTASLENRGGLSPDLVARNWEQLLDAASELELTVDSRIQEAAWKAVAEVSGGPTTTVEPEELEHMDIDALSELLAHPKLRLDAALRLLDKEDPELLARVYRALRKMPREEVLQVAPEVARFGELAADVLIDGLNARKTFVRQASALALGELKLRRSLAPLVQLLQTEPTEVWWEVGRVLAEYGGGIVRTLTRAMKDPQGPRERFSYTLAHLARTAPDKVRALESDTHEGVRAIAVESMTQRELVEKHFKAARSTAETEESPVFAFTRRFYGALNQS